MYDKITTDFSQDFSKKYSEIEEDNFIDEPELKIVEIDSDNNSSLEDVLKDTDEKELKNFKSIFNNFPFALISCDKQSNIKNVNSYTEELFQYKIDEIRDHSIFQLLSPESGLELQKIISNDFDNSQLLKNVTFKLKGRKLDATEIDLKANIIIDKDIDELVILMQETNTLSPVVSLENNDDNQNNFSYGLGRTISLTDKKETEPADLQQTLKNLYVKSHQNNEQKELNDIDFDTIFGNNFSIVFALNNEYKIVDVSASLINILGYSADELRDQYLTTKMSVEDIITFHKFLERVLQSGKKVEPVVLSLADKNGKYFPFELNGINISNSDKISIIVYAYEVTKWKNLERELKSLKSEMSKLIEEKISEFKSLTEKLNRENEWRKEAEKELRIKEERLELAIEVSDYGLWDYNFVSGQIYCNDNFCSILELNNKGTHIFYWIDFEKMIHESDKTLFYEAFENHISMASPLFEVEHRIVTQENKIKWVLTRGKIVQRDTDTNPLRFIGKLEDITFRKNNEEKMQSALNKGKELNELKSKFVSMLSHEIRNPLSQILSSSEILEMFINEMSDDEKLELIKKIQRSVDKLTEILNESVNIDNPEMLDKEILLSDFDLVKLCEKLIYETKILFEDSAAIHLEPESQKMMISSDINSLQQIISNLLSNSLKFTPRDKNIYIRLKTNEKSLILNIKDEGKGIEYFDHPKIFDPFYKGRNSEGTNGSGLGLTLVKRIVDSFNGKIEFESRPGAGTNFTVTIPIN